MHLHLSIAFVCWVWSSSETKNITSQRESAKLSLVAYILVPQWFFLFFNSRFNYGSSSECKVVELGFPFFFASMLIL
jgi:hypothetical protein